MGEEGTLRNSFNEATITLIPKPDKDNRKKEIIIKSTKLESKKGEFTIDNAEIQRIIKDYYEQLYSNEIDSLEDMDRFLEKFNLPRLNQKETEIMIKPITSPDIEAVIKNLSKNKSLEPDDFNRRILSNI